jgi:thymidine kinase
MTERLKGIAGSMFAGKTELLIHEIKNAEYAHKSVLVFKPAIDDRWGKIDKIQSHSQAEHDAYPITSPGEIIDIVNYHIEALGKVDLVAIEEIQFMDESIIQVIQELLEADIRVVFAGLNTDFRGEPFGPMPTLLCMSDEIVRPSAVCDHPTSADTVCGADATKTQRLVNGQPAKYDDPIVMIGAEESYHARCPNHHFVPGKK